MHQKSFETLRFILIATLIVMTATIDSEQVPTTFGLITVTHTRGGDNSQFMKYLNRYATMDCPIITQINIVWNNEQSMEQLGIYQNKNTWKRSVNFYRTPHNSMNWRYKIANQTKSQVFFSIDDDITVDCEELKKGFEVWRKNAIGSVGPIVSYGPRYFEYTRNNGFAYGRAQTQNVFNIGLVGLAFISRHFLELYYADAFEIQEMQAYVVQKNNCDDIGLNWIVQYFYPELKTITIQGNILNISPAVAQATRQDHYPFRTQCIQKFTQIFGESLRYFPLKDGYPNKEKRMVPLTKEIVLAKKQYLERYVIKKEQGNNAEKATDIFNKAIEQSKTKTIEMSAQQTQQRKIQNTPTSVHSDDSLTKEIYKLREELKYAKKQLHEMRVQAQKGKSKSETNDSSTSVWRTCFEFAMFLFIIFLFCRLQYYKKQKYGGSYNSRISSNQVDI